MIDEGEVKGMNRSMESVLEFSVGAYVFNSL